MTRFTVVFIHKLLYNAGKNRLRTKEKRAKMSDKIQKTFVAV